MSSSKKPSFVPVLLGVGMIGGVIFMLNRPHRAMGLWDCTYYGGFQERVEVSSALKNFRIESESQVSFTKSLGGEDVKYKLVVESDHIAKMTRMGYQFDCVR